MFYIPKGRYTMSEDTDYGIWKALYDIKSAWVSDAKKNIWFKWEVADVGWIVY
jgi:hypothetical protein